MRAISNEGRIGTLATKSAPVKRDPTASQEQNRCTSSAVMQWAKKVRTTRSCASARAAQAKEYGRQQKGRAIARCLARTVEPSGAGVLWADLLYVSRSHDRQFFRREIIHANARGADCRRQACSFLTP